jgi:adenine-specific DNA methylase
LGSDAVNNQADSRDLKEAMQAIIEYEEECIALANMGKPELLADFLQNCSLIKYLTSPGYEGAPRLHNAIRASLEHLNNAGLATSVNSLCTRWFGGVYFSFKQSVELDSLLTLAFSKQPEHRDTYLAAVLGTASDVVNTVGKHFAQPLKITDRSGRIKSHLIPKVIKDRTMDAHQVFEKWRQCYMELPRSHGKYHRTLTQDYRETLANLPSDTAIIYADPPYTRDHYSRFYHVLETLCLRTEPVATRVPTKGRVTVSRGLYGQERYQSPFCIPSQAANAFEQLFRLASINKIPLLLSYSPYPRGSQARPRLLTLSEVIRIASTHYRAVEVKRINLSHNKLNTRANSTAKVVNAEVVMLCQA